MNIQEKFKYWLEIAQYDLDTAEVMLKSGRWLYVVFMCQQAIEKLVKGLYILYIDDNIPYIHNIRVIIEKFESRLPEAVSDERYDLFEELTAYYLNGRYTDYKQKLSDLLDKETADVYYKQTKEAYTWLLTMKP